MGRWTQYDEDEYRLPAGFKRVGYDADTERYIFESSGGQTWEGASGSQYSEMRPVGHSSVVSRAEDQPLDSESEYEIVVPRTPSPPPAYKEEPPTPKPKPYSLEDTLLSEAAAKAATESPSNFTKKLQSVAQGVRRASSSVSAMKERHRHRVPVSLGIKKPDSRQHNRSFSLRADRVSASSRAHTDPDSSHSRSVADTATAPARRSFSLRADPKPNQTADDGTHLRVNPATLPALRSKQTTMAETFRTPIHALYASPSFSESRWKKAESESESESASPSGSSERKTPDSTSHARKHSSSPGLIGSTNLAHSRDKPSSQSHSPPHPPAIMASSGASDNNLAPLQTTGAVSSDSDDKPLPDLPSLPILPKLGNLANVDPDPDSSSSERTRSREPVLQT